MLLRLNVKINKKYLIFLVVIFLSLVQVNATAAIKTGATCLKPGAASTYLGKKYTCVKSGVNTRQLQLSRYEMLVITPSCQRKLWVPWFTQLI